MAFAVSKAPSGSIAFAECCEISGGVGCHISLTVSDGYPITIVNLQIPLEAAIRHRDNMVRVVDRLLIEQRNRLQLELEARPVFAGGTVKP
jgi:hypothetical protein